MRAHDQRSIFSTGRKFYPDYGLLLELRALTLVARSYALLLLRSATYRCFQGGGFTSGGQESGSLCMFSAAVCVQNTG